MKGAAEMSAERIDEIYRRAEGEICGHLETFRDSNKSFVKFGKIFALMTFHFRISIFILRRSFHLTFVFFLTFVSIGNLPRWRHPSHFLPPVFVNVLVVCLREESVISSPEMQEKNQHVREERRVREGERESGREEEREIGGVGWNMRSCEILAYVRWSPISLL